MQLKQRRSLKPASWFGVVLCSLFTGDRSLALFQPSRIGYGSTALAALMVDAISVFHREQKSIANELITFAAVCLSVP